MTQEPSTYRIAHISDLLQVPRERRARCVAEILSTLEKADGSAHVLNQEAPLPDGNYWELGSFLWIDDGKTDLEIMAVLGGEAHVLYSTFNDAISDPP